MSFAQYSVEVFPKIYVLSLTNIFVFICNFIFVWLWLLYACIRLYWYLTILRYIRRYDFIGIWLNSKVICINHIHSVVKDIHVWLICVNIEFLGRVQIKLGFASIWIDAESVLWISCAPSRVQYEILFSRDCILILGNYLRRELLIVGEMWMLHVPKYFN